MSSVAALSSQHLPQVAPLSALWQHCAALAARCPPAWAGKLVLRAGATAPCPRGGWRLSVQGPQGTLHAQVGSDFPALTQCAGLRSQALRQAVVELLLRDDLTPLLIACGQADAPLRWRLARRPLGARRRSLASGPGVGLQLPWPRLDDPPEPAAARPNQAADAHGGHVLDGGWAGPGAPPAFVGADATPSLVAAAGPVLHLMGGDAAWPQALQAHLRRRTRSLHGLAQLRLPGQVLLAQHRLPLAEVRTLRVGDVLLSARSGRDVQQALSDQGFLVCWGDPQHGHLRATCLQQDATMTLQTSVHLPSMPGVALASEDSTDGDAGREAGPDGADPQVPQGRDDAQPVDPGLLLEHLELPVTLWLEAPAMNLADLAALQAGTVLAMSVPPAQARVRVAVHGQTLGFGELVMVGEKLGVRLTRIQHPLQGVAP